MQSYFNFQEFLLSRRLNRLSVQVRDRGLTYLNESKLMAIKRECLAARNRKTSGRFIEAGCALAGSTALIAEGRPSKSCFDVFDTFEGMPAPTDSDSPDVHDRYKVIVRGDSIGIAGADYYGYRKDLLEHVEQVIGDLVSKRMQRGIKLNKGLLQESMYISDAVAFAHIDVDWYQPVLTCAERIFPFLEVGGVLIFDDYHDYGSCKRAVDDYFSSRKHLVSFDASPGSMVIRRLAQ